jgi:hypothetical protein
VAVQRERETVTSVASRPKPALEVVMEHRPARDVGARPAGGAESAVVVRVDVDPGRGHLPAHVVVSARMVAETVDE